MICYQIWHQTICIKNKVYAELIANNLDVDYLVVPGINELILPAENLPVCSSSILCHFLRFLFRFVWNRKFLFIIRSSIKHLIFGHYSSPQHYNHHRKHTQDFQVHFPFKMAYHKFSIIFFNDILIYMRASSIFSTKLKLRNTNRISLHGATEKYLKLAVLRTQVTCNLKP